MPECDRCGRAGEPLVLERTLSGDWICEDCQETLRNEDTTREAGQQSLAGGDE